MSKFFIKMDTTAPTGVLVSVPFDSTVAFGPRQIRHLNIKRVSLAVENNQAFTLEGSFSNDGGTTWNIFDTRAVAAAGAGVISGPFDYLIDTYDDMRIQITNGGSDQTTWRPVLMGHETRVPGT